MKLLLKITIVSSILLVYVGMHSEELIARFFSEYDRYNREAVTLAYKEAASAGPEAMIKAQQLDIDSREFYSGIKDRSKRLVWWSSVLFYTSLGLLLKGDIEELVAKLRSRHRRPARPSAKSSHNEPT